MPDKEKEGAGFPTGGVFVILAILLGYFIVPDQPFKTSRQSIPDKAKSQVQESTSVEARLWEDPFEAVKRSKDYQDPKAGGLDSIQKGRIAEKILKTQDEALVILGVMVLGGEYAESSEMRRRSRYALLSGLVEQGYYPDHYDQLNFLRFPISGSEPTKSKLSDVIPYESYSPDPSISKRASPAPHVLVLWLNQDRLHPHPLSELGILISKIKNEIRPKEKTKSLSPCKIKFKLLGPADSTTLKAIIDEVRVSGTGEKGPSLPALHDVEMYCWGATADEFLLTGEDARSNAEFNLSHALREKFAVRFYRTIGTDSQLMKALVDELELRKDPNDSRLKLRKDPLVDESKPRDETSCSDRVALISEWDTIYGRTLPKAFAIEASGLKNILRFSYMRGIDGQISKANEGEKAPEPSSQGSKKGSQVGGIEKPVGNSQFDYLRRLSRDLKEIDVDLRKKGCGVKAIGVLGSDIYDKLLLLQSIYDLFPGAIFFTTDLDARFLHPDELQWTRNLVIASNFGLRLHPGIQKNTPPFRDSYQTALFFTTLLALNPGLADKETADCASVILQPPRIFEVGRSDAFDLPPKTKAAKDTPNRCDGLKPILHNSSSDSRSIHPELRKECFLIIPSMALWAIAIAFIFLFILYAIAVYYWNVGKDTVLKLRIVIGALVCLAALGGILWVVVNLQIEGGEPFTLLEGISIWPTVYVRVVACMAAIGLIFTVCWRSRGLERQLLKYFEHARPPSREPTSAAPGGGNTSVNCAQNLWEAYRQHNSTGKRLMRVACLAIPYGLLCGAIISVFGPLFVPFRGPTSLKAYEVSLAMAVVAFIVLLFWVVDATNAAVWFIRQIQNGFRGGTEKAESRTAQRFGVTVEDSREWIGVEVVAQLTEIVNKFIYYPILVIILLGISRLSYFDRYDMPPGLLMVILLGLGFSISCAIRLRGKAEQFRKGVLKRLWEKQVRLAGGENESKGLSKKIDLMIDQIKSIRSGAFVPFIEQPWVRATLIFITSGGGLTVLQYLPWFQ
jgi:hypothetical protein